MKLYHSLFPQLKNNKWAEVNLNAIALEYDNSETKVSSEDEEHWVNQLHKMMGVNHSWGGWMEGRHHLLRHQYNKGVGEDHFWHLGVDYNVPAGTNVHLPIDAELVYCEMDPDQDGGWGGKLIFKHDKCYFIFGHLDSIVTELKAYKAGEVVAKVGDRTLNGNWFPHLHVQCMRELNVKVDGYSHRYKEIEVDFPNPDGMLL